MEILGLDKIKKSGDNTQEMNITGLDKIKQINHTESTEVTGLEFIRQLSDSTLPEMSKFAAGLIQLIKRAGELDNECEQFGADRHRYRLNPVVPLSKVREFEQRHQINIPQGYVDFLTQVGNGGAGPYYGIYSLEELEYRNFYAHSSRHVDYQIVRNEPDYYTYPYSISGKTSIIHSGLTKEIWDQWAKAVTDVYQTGNQEAYRSVREEGYSGLLEIASAGSTYCIMLICDGDMCGQTSFFDHGLQMPHPTGKSFEDWIIGYFKEVIGKFDDGTELMNN